MVSSDSNGANAVDPGGATDGTKPSGHEGGPPTNILVLRGGSVYFEGAADELLKSSDEYLKKFLVSAE